MIFFVQTSRKKVLKKLLQYLLFKSYQTKIEILNSFYRSTLLQVVIRVEFDSRAKKKINADMWVCEQDLQD